MTKKRKSYAKQFKIDTVKLVTEQGYKISEAARNLGINQMYYAGGKTSLKPTAIRLFQAKAV